MVRTLAAVSAAFVAMAVAWTVPVANAAPDISGSGCVQSGQTQEYCIGRFLETVDSIPSVGTLSPEDRERAIHSGVYTVNSLMMTDNLAQLKDTYWRMVQEFKDKNPWATDVDARGFVTAAVHWFGPTNLEASVEQVTQ